jgi:hypothetical protein
MVVLSTLCISVSLTLIVVRSKLTEGLRHWIVQRSNPNEVSIGYAINCPQCTGIYAGFITSICCLPAVPLQGAEIEFYIATVTFGTALLAQVIDKYLTS